MNPHLLTVSQLSEFLQVKPCTVYAWVEARKVPHILLSAGGRKECVRFDQKAIETWLEERTRKAKPDITKWDLR